MSKLSIKYDKKYSSGFVLVTDNETNTNNINTFNESTPNDQQFTKSFENYNDFGSTLNGKFATRYAITPQFAFRGSVSTGFRAPSLAQKYYSQQFTNFQGGQLVTIQLASNDSKLASSLGIPQLKQETSLNGSAGFTFNTGKFTATIDGYYIRVKDRIVLRIFCTSRFAGRGSGRKSIY